MHYTALWVQENNSGIPLLARCQVFITLSSFTTYESSSYQPLSSSLRIIGSYPRWEEEPRTGGFSGAPLITKERQPAIKPTPHTEPSVSRVHLKVWLNPNKHLILIWPSLPLGENESSQGVPTQCWGNLVLYKEGGFVVIIRGKGRFPGGSGIS